MTGRQQIPTSLGPALVSADGVWVLDVSSLPVLHGLSVLSRALAEMVKSNRRFDRLDSVLVESASQFAEPTGRAVARVTLVTGAVVEGEVLWMNATHIKLRLTDQSEIIIAKETAAQIAPVSGTDTSPDADFSPDRWVGRALDVG